MSPFKPYRMSIIALAACAAACLIPPSVQADDAHEIQTLKDQLRTLQHRLEELGAHANDRAATVATPNPVPATASAATTQPGSSLTYMGITVYGTLDVGVAYLNHGAPLSDTYGPGLPFLIQKFSNHSIVSAAPNGLSQSKLGISGLEHLTDDLFAVFKAETGFNPTSGRLTDGPASLVKNNGKPTDQQSTGSDSSRAGQLLQGPAFAGVGSRLFGTLTVGRQNSLMADDLIKYDPQQQSQAFSPLGYSGTSGGAGDTEDKILDNAVKYSDGWGPMRLALLHQFGKDGSIPATSNQADVGADCAALSVDILWSQINGAVSASSLNAAQAATLAPGTLAGTISDNSAWSVQASYDLKPLKLYFGWERIRYANPDHPVAAGTQTIGGYVLSTVTNTAYAIDRIFTIDWTGARYSVSRKLDLTGAFYQYHQDSYAKVTCSDSKTSTCSGNTFLASGVADYHFTKRFDTYLGINWSEVQGGLSNGYLYRSDWAPMLGGRFSF